MNLREKAQKLGKLQVKIYWEHDRCDFEELAQAARELYELLGYEKKEATEIGWFKLIYYSLIKVGISHFHKNQLECEENASQYWYIILKNQAELNLYLG
jgi:hypothetical protein